jgi:hypothetical protein
VRRNNVVEFISRGITSASLMRRPFDHNPTTEHTLYLLLFITNGGGV